MAIDCPMICHLLFADDSLVFFLEATKHYGEKMVEILQLYCNASGQCVNLDDSSMIFSSDTTLMIKGDVL